VELLKTAQKTKKNLAQVQEEHDSAKQNLDRAAYVTYNSLCDVNRKNEFTSLERGCDFFEAYRDFFQKGTRHPF
jgi:hypothetical protein